ncbi:transmembrane protein 255B [Scleropages formosus]|uniref:Transmembrane protein 255B-like n=1 Tax=Scleropages formosus TaxID=113540 RepID=A0A8C9V5H7_SCLFO|nr:transmembrane protein 255B-like [Scleropages formosus]
MASLHPVWPVMMKRRRRRTVGLVVTMLCLSLTIVTLGAYSTTRTESIAISGYGAGVILAFGSFLGLLGLCLEENRRQLLVASIIFLSFGIIASFFCLVLDGVFILLSIDMRPLKAGRCQFYTSGNSYIYENYYTTVPCQGLMESCSMKVRSGTCYCCDLYDCANGGYLNNRYEFVGVRSCEDVLSLYRLLWVVTALNLVAFVLGVLTTAVLGSIKNQKPCTAGQSLCSELGGQESVDSLSPTAPLLPDHDVYPLTQNTPLYFMPAAGPNTSQRSSMDPPRTEPKPPAFAPLFNLLP